MQNRLLDSETKFMTSYQYFHDLIQRRKKEFENDTILSREHDDFLARLDHLKNCVSVELRIAHDLQNLSSQDYLRRFISKLQKLQHVVENSNNLGALNNALNDVMATAESPVEIGKEILTVIGALAIAIVGAVIGAVVGGIAMAISMNFGGLFLAMTVPEIYLSLIAGAGIAGAIYGIVGGAIQGYALTKDLLKTPTHIETATTNLFKPNQSTYNSHLFFPKIPAKQQIEEKSQPTAPSIKVA